MKLKGNEVICLSNIELTVSNIEDKLIDHIPCMDKVCSKCELNHDEGCVLIHLLFHNSIVI